MYTPEQVQAMCDRILSIAGFFSAITPTQIDDKVVSVMKDLVAQEWFVPTVAALLNLMEGKKFSVAEKKDLVHKVLLEKLS